MEIIPYNSSFYAPDVDPLFPTSVTMPVEKAVQVGDGDTAFGFVYCGVACIEKATIKRALQAGMFFSTPGPATIMGLQGFVCHRKGYRGLPLWGGGTCRKTWAFEVYRRLFRYSSSFRADQRRPLPELPIYPSRR